MKTVFVYDEFKKQYRKLDPCNYDDDLTVGAVIFERTALQIIMQSFVVCGYMIFSKMDKRSYPIDIHPDKIVLLEGTYNCLSEELKKELVRFNTTNHTGSPWSRLFVEWILLGSWDCFTQNGPFIEMCLHFIEEEGVINNMIEEEISIIEPHSYDELCEMVNNAIQLSGADFYTPDYFESYKYLIDALLHHYHINFSLSDITDYMYQICNIINMQWEERHG